MPAENNQMIRIFISDDEMVSTRKKQIPWCLKLRDWHNGQNQKKALKRCIANREIPAVPVSGKQNHGTFFIHQKKIKMDSRKTIPLFWESGKMVAYRVVFIDCLLENFLACVFLCSPNTLFEEDLC